jgi:uncharacterized protein with PIN domain
MNLSNDPPAPPLKLLTDGMFGRLTRWLRVLGYDTVYAPDTDDRELLRRARAEDRVLVTADHALAARPGARTLLIEAPSLADQLRQVRTQLGRPPGAMFSRCVACNGELEPVEKSLLADRVPPHVLATQLEFHRCPDCGRIYWPGTHVSRMKTMLPSSSKKRRAGRADSL